ncbi:MAG: hypothetical protein JST50_11340 [Bacteroidetes bacterium]|jgi:plasmid stabilization system protein ParE|nr:hypothetical protein [Bacteroidota bacterium]
MIAINWTPEAEKTFLQNLEYLAYQWNNKVITDFINKVDDALQVIAQNPNAFPLHKSTLDIHKCVTIPFYRIVNNNSIDLITFWNNYQDPNKLKIT